MALASLARHGLLASAPLDDDSATPASRSLEQALSRPYGYAPPAPGGCVVIRTREGEVYVGDFISDTMGLRVNLLGSREQRTWRRSQLVSVALADCRHAELREICRRQRAGHPACVIKLTPREIAKCEAALAAERNRQAKQAQDATQAEQARERQRQRKQAYWRAYCRQQAEARNAKQGGNSREA